MPAPTPSPSSALCDGGQLAARFLSDAGVQYIFSLSGGPLNLLYSGCLDAGIEVVHTRHDTAAAFMAEGCGRASRGPGVCAVTLGTAVAMTAPAVFNAELAAVPLVVLAGAAALPTWDRRPFAHGDQLAMLKPIAKWARAVYSTARIPEYLATALREATRGRPGPAVLEIPSDVMYGKVDVGQVRLPHGYLSHARPQGDPALVREAVALLGRAQRPLLIAGSGVWWSEGAAALRVLVERLARPVLSERLGSGSLPAGHPLNFVLSAVALTALKHCDLLVMLGARFDYLLDYGDPPVLNPTARVIQVDVEPEEIGYNHAVDLGVVGDARAVCQQIAAEVEGGDALPD